MATTKRMLHWLLHYALIELRAYGHESGDQRVFLLADLVHNVPLQLERVDRNETSPDDVMQWLQTRAQRNGIAGWLDLRVEDVVKYGHDGKVDQDPAT